MVQTITGNTAYSTFRKSPLFPQVCTSLIKTIQLPSYYDVLFKHPCESTEDLFTHNKLKAHIWKNNCNLNKTVTFTFY